MKQSHLALAALAASAFLIVSFDATPAKPFISKSFSYIKGSANQRIEPGNSNQKDSRENSITDSTYTNIANWTEVSNATILQMSSEASFISTVTIHNWEDRSNGSDEDGISLQEALNAVFTFYINNGYPSKLEIDLNGNGASASVTCSKTGSAQ